MWTNILLVGFGSMIGGVSRYLVSEGMRHWINITFPLATFIVNTAGCFLIGLLAGMLHSSSIYFSEQHKLLFIIGFCGSFTTFSTFSLDNLMLLSSKAYTLAGLNVFLSVAGGLLATYVGYHLTRQ